MMKTARGEVYDNGHHASHEEVQDGRAHSKGGIDSHLNRASWVIRVSSIEKTTHVEALWFWPFSVRNCQSSHSRRYETESLTLLANKLACVSGEVGIPGIMVI